MFKSYKIKCILLIILVMGVFVMPSNIFGNKIKNIIGQIKYRETYVTGEITADNGDGTYNVKINNADTAYKDVETRGYNVHFSIGEIVDIGYEYGNKESPKILGPSKKLPQEPKLVEVNYSGGCAGGLRTIEVTIDEMAGKNGNIDAADVDYTKMHNSIDGSDLDSVDIYMADDVGQIAVVNSEIRTPGISYEIVRAYIYFDTSSIPENSKIIIAKLSLYGMGALMGSGDFYVVVQDGQPDYPHIALISSDYHYLKYYNNGGQIAASAVGVGAYNNIPLNPNGRTWINAGGITKFCLRSSFDISSKIPADDELNQVGFEAGVGNNVPKLIITYEI